MSVSKWALGSRGIHASVSTFKDQMKIHIRYHSEVDAGKVVPTKKGITLSYEEWVTLGQYWEEIQQELDRQYHANSAGVFGNTAEGGVCATPSANLSGSN